MAPASRGNVDLRGLCDVAEQEHGGSCAWGKDK